MCGTITIAIMSNLLRKEIAFVGIKCSPAFVRAPESNGCAERLIRTLKENILWVRTFETIEELARRSSNSARPTTTAG